MLSWHNPMILQGGGGGELFNPNFKAYIYDSHIVCSSLGCKTITKELHEANKIIASRDKDAVELNKQIQNKFHSICDLGKAIQSTSKNKSLCEKELSCKIQEIVKLKEEISTLSSTADNLRKDWSDMKAENEVASCERSGLRRESDALVKKVNEPFNFPCYHYSGYF